jgi:hypothetical protein
MAFKKKSKGKAATPAPMPMYPNPPQFGPRSDMPAAPNGPKYHPLTDKSWSTTPTEAEQRQEQQKARELKYPGKSEQETKDLYSKKNHKAVRNTDLMENQPHQW